MKRMQASILRLMITLANALNADYVPLVAVVKRLLEHMPPGLSIAMYTLFFMSGHQFSHLP